MASGATVKKIGA